MDPAIAIAQADARAQDTFREALDARIETGEWSPELVDAYENAEQDVRWEVSKAALDAAITADLEALR